MSLELLQHLLTSYGYLLLFPLCVIEGPIVTVIAGAMVSFGYLSFLPALAVVIAGDTVGDILHYVAGRYGGKPFIGRWGRYLGIRDRHMERLARSFRDHDIRTYLLGKLTHGVGGAILAAAGLARAPFGRFLLWNVIGTTIKSFILLLLGYHFAHLIGHIRSIFDVVASVFVIVSLVALIGFFWWRHGKTEEV